MATTVPRRDRVLRCVISAADRGSTLDHDGMLRAMTAMRDPGPGTGAILLTGGGANFCTGGDVGAFAAAGHAVGPAVEAMAGEFHTFARALAACPVPVIAAVHGWAAGAGMSIVCLDAEAIAIAASAAGAEGREGIRAFRERRPPRFHDEPVSG